MFYRNIFTAKKKVTKNAPKHANNVYFSKSSFYYSQLYDYL